MLPCPSDDWVLAAWIACLWLAGSGGRSSVGALLLDALIGLWNSIAESRPRPLCLTTLPLLSVEPRRILGPGPPRPLSIDLVLSWPRASWFCLDRIIWSRISDVNAVWAPESKVTFLGFRVRMLELADMAWRGR